MPYLSKEELDLAVTNYGGLATEVQPLTLRP